MYGSDFKSIEQRISISPKSNIHINVIQMKTYEISIQYKHIIGRKQTYINSLRQYMVN